MKPIAKEIKIALAAICAVVLLFYGINFLKGVNLFKKSNMYYVVFNDITGLSKNNAVYAGGYPIGTVHEINYDYDHPGHIVVGVVIDEQMKLPKGSTAELVSSMLGTTTMNLLLAPSTDYLQPGDSIKGGPHLGALEMASAMVPKIEQMLPKLDSIMASINLLLSDSSIMRTLHNTEALTANLKQGTGDLNKLIRNDLPSLMAKMDRIGDNVEQLTGRLKDIDYAATIENINRTISDARQFTQDLNKKINSKDGSLGLLLNDRTIYDNLNNTLISSDSLLRDRKGHPKRYVHFSIFGRKDK